ncbi:MAG: hypothetical protein OMM_07547 [Candidatus Magnetoglobus multicellularis str. Araruama]|uniref:Uncharacterized protein n=1 Tax=Candidatus Magnetoglobus multicellularis str. Araruama TaxID=890399 RepID=A0A1V1PBY9_9BACT|nr:MAG: hypothetical protein OMM_07547 [Candidatus Magnetoglobus multicellularis str. Araruama]
MIDSDNVYDLPRCGRPPTYSETFKLELIAFYCQTTPFPNSGRWTLRWAEIHLAAHPEIVNATPGKSTIHRILKEIILNLISTDIFSTSLILIFFRKCITC